MSGIRHLGLAGAALAVLALAACSKSAQSPASGTIQPKSDVIAAAPANAKPSTFQAAEDAIPGNPLRNVYFGDVHVHTSYSFDAFTNGTKTRPQDAYDWAKGKAITGSGQGPDIKIITPLDFYAVSDHAEFMGVFNQMGDPNSPLSKTALAKGVTSPDSNTRIQTFAGVLRDMSMGKVDPTLTDPKISRSVWAEIVKTADANYEPGKFTTFPAFEWTSNPNKRNLHRVVVFRDSANVPDLVMSALDSDKPEKLWEWMEGLRAKGSTLFAIPHNGNASDGRMFELVKSDGQPIDASYSATRGANEPLYEITQIKGTSETHPDLSPNDEFASFEQWDYTLSADAERPTHRKGSFARQALLDGIAMEGQGKGNPFKYGFIGDSDTHNAAASTEEFNYSGKFAVEGTPEHRLIGFKGQPPAQAQQIREFSSGGIAGVWAEKNTRGAIFDAMKRKETFGTSGPLMKVRFFGGWDFTPADVQSADFVKIGYQRGVPMGGDLKPGAAKAPTFMAMAMKDPRSGNLDRIQIVKGWVDASGGQHEKIYDVAWSGDRKPLANGKLPPVGNTVDVAKATYTNTIGAPQLTAHWSDPDFDPKVRSFYYARVIEIPTPRWSTYDAARLHVAIPKGLPAAIQERAWTSPIWYNPA
jgi:hypothetical protein